MTKKHVEALAKALKEQKPTEEHARNVVGFNGHPCTYFTGQYVQWCRDVQGIADVCEQFNGNFDGARFLQACGLTR